MSTEPGNIEPGDAAPPFELPASFGRTASAAALQGRAFVLYFNPKADTSGCTAEARDFQAALPRLEALGLAVIGVSRDPMRAIERFATKQGLSFPLASDEDGTAAAAYGTWVEKSMYGRKYMGVERSTFLVGADGRVARVWRKVKVDGHADAVLHAAGELG